MPGQGVKVDYAAIIEILIQQLDSERKSGRSYSWCIINHGCFPDDEIQQSTALRWLAEFLVFAHEVMVPFTPRLIPAILPNLAHHVVMIQSAAIRTNKLLLNVIQKLPSPQEPPPFRPPPADKANPSTRTPRSPEPVATASTSTSNATNSRQSTLSSQASRETSSPELALDSNQPQQSTRGRASNADPTLTPRAGPAEILPITVSRPHSPVSFISHSGVNSNLENPSVPEEVDPFDYQATVNELTVQFLSEFEETRVAALKWLIMLHQKAPKKVCSSTPSRITDLTLDSDSSHG